MKKNSEEIVIIKPDFSVLDTSNADSFKKEILVDARQYQHVIIDLENVTFIDSSGLGSILGAMRQISASGGKLVLCSAQKNVSSLFEMVQLFRVIDVYPDSNEAAKEGFIKTEQADYNL